MCSYLEARTGIEPVHRGFADRSVSTSPPGRRDYYYNSDLPTMKNPLKDFKGVDFFVRFMDHFPDLMTIFLGLASSAFLKVTVTTPCSIFASGSTERLRLPGTATLYE